MPRGYHIILICSCYSFIVVRLLCPLLHGYNLVSYVVILCCPDLLNKANHFDLSNRNKTMRLSTTRQYYIVTEVKLDTKDNHDIKLGWR